MRAHPIGQTEELERLVHEMRTEIVPDPAARAGPLPPAVADLRTEPVEVRFEVPDAADAPLRDGLADAEIIAVPAPVVEDAQQPPPVPRRGGQPARLGEVEGEGLVDHDVLARRQGGPRQGRVGVVRGGDHDEVDGLRRGHRDRIRRHPHVGQVGPDPGGRARADQPEVELRHGADERGMEGPAGIAVADQTDPDPLPCLHAAPPALRGDAETRRTRLLAPRHRRSQRATLHPAGRAWLDRPRAALRRTRAATGTGARGPDCGRGCGRGGRMRRIAPPIRRPEARIRINSATLLWPCTSHAVPETPTDRGRLHAGTREGRRRGWPRRGSRGG